jgi:hypothetical protein
MLYISQRCRPPQPVTGITLLFFFYEDDVRTSQETPMAFHGLYGDSFAFLYEDDVLTSQETPLGFQGLVWRYICFFICR